MIHQLSKARGILTIEFDGDNETVVDFLLILAKHQFRWDYSTNYLNAMFVTPEISKVNDSWKYTQVNSEFEGYGMGSYQYSNRDLFRLLDACITESERSLMESYDWVLIYDYFDYGHFTDPFYRTVDRFIHQKGRSLSQTTFHVGCRTYYDPTFFNLFTLFCKEDWETFDHLVFLDDQHNDDSKLTSIRKHVCDFIEDYADANGISLEKAKKTISSQDESFGKIIKELDDSKKDLKQDAGSKRSYTTEISKNWSRYDQTVGQGQLLSYGVIFLDDLGVPIDNDFIVEELFDKYQKSGGNKHDSKSDLS